MEANLARRFKGNFEPHVRHRGFAYIPRVRLLATGSQVQAEVQGSRLYHVAFSSQEPELDAECDCPFFARGELCKHIWATMLAVDKGTPATVDPRSRSDAIWHSSLAQVRLELSASSGGSAEEGRPWPAGRKILYVINQNQSLQNGDLFVETLSRDPKKDGSLGRPVSLHIERARVRQLPAVDREMLSLFALSQNGYYYGGSQLPRQIQLEPPLPFELLAKLCALGQLHLRTDDPALHPLTWDEGLPWELCLEVAATPDGGHALVGSLRRGEERQALTEPSFLVSSGLLFGSDRVARLEHSGAFAWIAFLRRRGALPLPRGRVAAAVVDLLDLPSGPRIDLPPELQLEEIVVAPVPHLRVTKQKRHFYSDQPGRLSAALSFDYEDQRVAATKPGGVISLPDSLRVLRRDAKLELAAKLKLGEVGFSRPRSPWQRDEDPTIAPGRLPAAVRALLAEGWQVEAEGSLYRKAGVVHVEVQSGVDWFDLEGSVEFGDQVAHLPELLAALRRHDPFVKLDDGSFGLLPEEWLKKYVTAGAMAQVEGDQLRFRRSQAGLLDALLEVQPEVRWDEAFGRVRKELQRFERVEARDAPKGFAGQLRGYQREGLGWLDFLRRFGFGGCLADDMGLGKTVQVLALLEARRKARDHSGPSLVVAPRSLIFNWKQEAARFTPRLRLLEHTGIDRLPPGEHFKDHDVVLTTYGTLRRDAAALCEIQFDYVILDEAQAVKNAATESAKAARLLKGAQRLALSGTPIENHLGELWSLFEFLNPGLLGASSAFENAVVRNPDEATRRVLSRALRPFILRRTKEQVARDLPTKSEQLLRCELEPKERRLYDELRDHFRASLLGRIDKDGLARSKMHVLEALLRLRQAACHPGLVDKTRAEQSSSKLDTLQDQLRLVLAGGHKALVFSQFTQLLGILRRQLDAAGLRYEYLDGRTRDRGARVERFQTEPGLKLFLISLKAGGLGLNLTAADYVFLLDPWWNPAVEAQAIDRAHRIGQDKPVFAYRLITSNTIEEKVLALQERKRNLADVILGAEEGLLRTLTRADLEQLLS